MASECSPVQGGDVGFQVNGVAADGWREEGGQAAAGELDAEYSSRIQVGDDLIEKLVRNGEQVRHDGVLWFVGGRG